MELEDFANICSTQQILISDFKILFNNLGDSSSEHAMEEALKSFNTVKKNYKNALKALEAMPPPDETGQEDAQELFAAALKKVTSSEGTPLELGDKSIVCSQPARIPKDPITQQQIQIPAKNKVCHHIYEHEAIKEYIISKKKSKKGGNIRCPCIGCMNDNLQLEDIEIDIDLREQIALMSLDESTILEESYIGVD